MNIMPTVLDSKVCVRSNGVNFRANYKDNVQLSEENYDNDITSFELKRAAQSETVQPIEQTDNSSKSKQMKNNIAKAVTAVLCFGTMFAHILGCGSKTPTPPQGVNTLLFFSSDNIATVVETLEKDGYNPSFIFDYNNINIEEVSEIDRLDLPFHYDYIQSVIDMKTEELQESDYASKEQENLRKEIKALKAKREDQERVAKAYADDKFVYFIINADTGKYPNGINVEEFETIFDIKDGVLEKYNELNYILGQVEQEASTGHTQKMLQNDRVIKVPSDAILLKKINLESYM